MSAILQGDDATAAVRHALAGGRGRGREVWFHGVLVLAMVMCLGVLVTVLGSVAAEGTPVLAQRGLGFLTQGTSSVPSRAGVAQGLVGSLVLILIVAVVALPVGIMAAVYLEEYAHDTRWTRFVRSNIRNLAGVPAIVYGLLGLALFVEAMRGFTGGQSLLSGGLTLAVMMLALVVITTSEALRAVPDSLREAGYGVGATRWEVTRSHVLPAAAPGILTGTVLALARAFGETAPLIMVGAVTGFFTNSGGLGAQLTERFTSLPTLIFAWSRNPNAEFRALTSAAILVLLVVIVIVNAVAIIARDRYERKR